MDYGLINGIQTGATLVAPKRYTQVYQATHNGEDYLPFMYRSFISFSFGGKNIEDFNLIAITENNAMQKQGYADFTDITSSYDILDGQLYWGTKMNPNKIEFVLVTDGITQNQLDDFLYWFQPGIQKELILAEHPNRCILARVSNSPTISVLPFEEKITVQIENQPYETSTTMYKGKIQLNFIADEPYWYGIRNLFGSWEAENERLVDKWINANGELVNILTDKDAIKIIQEDNIPLASMLEVEPVVFGDGYTVDLDPNYSVIAQNDEDTNVLSHIWDPSTPDIKEARIVGKIGLAIENGFYLHKNAKDELYFYYSGTAPSLPTLYFTLTPTFDSNGFIDSPKNKFTSPNTPYNVITIENKDIKKTFYFTLPSIYYSYNQVIEILDQSGTINEEKLVKIRKRVRDEVKHKDIRAWAIHILDQVRTTSEYKNMLKLVFYDNNNNLGNARFTVNSKTGEVSGLIGRRKMVGQYETHLMFNGGEPKEYVGDMVRSELLIIEGRNYFSTNGTITVNDVYSLYHDVENGLSNVFINYKNMYL